MESSEASPTIIWEGEASVPCDEIVEGVSGPSLFGSDFCLTQYCTVEVWQLPSRGNDVVISCVASDTEAEYATKLTCHEWAALGFPPLTAKTPTSAVAAACESLCRVLRIMSSGRLRIEAAQKAIFQGKVELGNDRRLYKVHVWEAATAECSSSNSDYESHRRALVVKAELLDRHKKQPQQELVLRVDSAMLDMFEEYSLQTKQQQMDEHQEQLSRSAVSTEALCAELITHLELDNSGGLQLNLSSRNIAALLQDSALKTRLTDITATPAAAADSSSSAHRPVSAVATEATRTRPKSAGSQGLKQRGDANEPKSFLRWRKRLPPRWRKDLDNALAHAYAPPLYASTPARPRSSGSHRHRAHVQASKGNSAEADQQQQQHAAHEEHASPRKSLDPFGEHATSSDPFGAANNENDPNLDASPHAPDSATAAQQRNVINFGYLRQELRGLSSWNAQTSAPPSVLRRELKRADLLTGGFIKPLQPTVSVLHSNQSRPKEEVGFGTGAGDRPLSPQQKEGFSTGVVEPPERVVFSSGQGLKMLRRRSSPSGSSSSNSASNHQGPGSRLHQGGAATTTQPSPKGRMKLSRPKSAPQRSNTRQPLLHHTPHNSQPREGEAEDPRQRLPSYPLSLQMKKINTNHDLPSSSSNGPQSWTTDDIIETRGAYLEHGVPSALVPGRGGSPDRVQPLGCGGEFDRMPQRKQSPLSSPDEKHKFVGMPVRTSNAAKDDEVDKNADFIAEDGKDKDFIAEDERDEDFIAEDEKDNDFIDENEGYATFIAEDERDKDFIAEDEKDADFIVEDTRYMKVTTKGAMSGRAFNPALAIAEDEHNLGGGNRFHVSLRAQGPEVVPLDIPSIHTKPRKKLKKKKCQPKNANANPAFEDIGPDRVYPKDQNRRHLGGSAVRVAQWRRLRRDRASRDTQAQHIGLAARVILKYRPGSAIPGPVRRSATNPTAGSAAAAAATFDEATAEPASSRKHNSTTFNGPTLRHGEARALRMPVEAKAGSWSRSSEAEHAWAANQGPPPPHEEGAKSQLSPQLSAYPRSPTRRPLEDKNARLRERQMYGKETSSSSGSISKAAGPLSSSRKSVELVGVRAVAITGKWRHKAMHMGISRTTSQPPAPES